MVVMVADLEVNVQMFSYPEHRSNPPHFGYSGRRGELGRIGQ